MKCAQIGPFKPAALILLSKTASFKSMWRTIEIAVMLLSISGLLTINESFYMMYITMISKVKLLYFWIYLTQDCDIFERLQL